MALLGDNSIHFAFDFSSILICLTVILFSLIHQRTEKPQNKIFIGLVAVVFMNSICELITNYLEPMRYDSDLTYRLMDASRLGYFLLHAFLAPAFFYYVACVCGAISKLTVRQNILFSSLFIVNEFTVIMNPFAHWVYHFDERRIYCRDWGVYVLYAVAAIYFIFAIKRLLFSWEALTAMRRLALFYFVSLVIVGIVIQMIWVDLKVELFAESLGLLGIMLSVENEDDKLDVATRVYNRRALANDLDSYILNKQVFRIFCIKITNTDMAERTVNMDIGSALRKTVAEYLKTVFPRYHIYITSSDTFAVTVFNKSDDELVLLADNLSSRFDSPWILGDAEILLNAVVMSANVPDRIKSSSDALYMADSPIPANNDKKILTDTDLDYLMRRAEVEKAIRRGLEEHTFEVYYQPTYCLDGFRLHGAEALIRLHDSVLGHVYPSEFIPLAEKMGLIDDLDDFVLCEVCAFLKTGIPAECGLDNINVNLSVIQCMRPGFVERINRIVNGYGIDRRYINFEITETVAAGDYRLLSKTINALKREGFMFSMDDYGTGYSNMQSIFSLDFDIVKIDKSILWSAEKGELGRIILENSVRMIKQMNRRILVEGVETRRQIDMLAYLDVDYLQGYYFSRPIPKSDFITLIRNASGNSNK